jgi:hypothetical protein
MWEEMIAKHIEAEPNKNTNAYSHFWLPLNIEGVRLDFAHHGRAGRLEHTKLGVAGREAFYESVTPWADGRLPHVAVRSHVHRPIDTYDNYPVRYLITPSWQASTSYGHRLGAGKPLPIGDYLFICSDGEYELRKYIWNPKRDKPWKLPKVK